MVVLFGKKNKYNSAKNQPGEILNKAESIFRKYFSRRHGKELNMLLFESDNGYKKVCIWKDEIPFNHVSHNTMHLCAEAGDINWHIGTICIEVKLHPRHISNYAMVCMKYTNNQKNKTDIIINFGKDNISFKSQVLPFNKAICLGLDEEFADAVNEFFKEYPLGKLPGGTIEILSGGYDEVGSSNAAFKKVMELLVFVFQHIDELSDDVLQCSLLSLM